MRFEKGPLTIPQQIALLESRGMLFRNKAKAAHYLSNISYYRLSAYWFTFLKEPKGNHIFNEGTFFEQAVDTYVFDRKLRLLIFDEIERIEIALRTQIIYHFSHEFGPNWYERRELFRRPEYCYKLNDLLSEETRKTTEVFIRHYRRKYTDPVNPPAWMVLELASFGQLSLLFKNLRNSTARKGVAEHFAVHENILESWLETLSYVRNTCAHHSRLWNRKLPKSPIVPVVTGQTWLNDLPPENQHNRIYLALCVIRYLLRCVVPDSSFNRKLQALIGQYPALPVHYMGFTGNWKDEPLWKNQ